MRIRPVVVSASLALSIVLPCAAQSPAGKGDPYAPPADAPVEVVMPKMAMPADGWTDADKGEAALKRAAELLEKVQKAYSPAATPFMTDNAQMKLVLPNGEMTESIELAFGKGNDTRIKQGGFQIIVVGDTFNLVPERPAELYLSKKFEGGIGDAIDDVLDGFALPIPDFALRHPAKGTTVLDAFTMGGNKKMKLVGFRERAGLAEVLMTGPDGDTLVGVDPKTNFVRSMRAIIRPEGLPTAVGLEISMTPAAEEPKAPIAFAPGSRKAVASFEELSAPQAAPAPESKVKVGDPAPVAKLKDLDGKEVDLASYKGKVVVIDFWATWCPPCRKGLPLLQQFADQMKDNDKVVICPVSTRENAKGDELKKAITDFWSQQKFTMKTLVDADSAFISAYGFEGIPAFVIIGPDGKLAATHLGFDPKLVETLKAEVEKALAGASK
jgi:thiol-disulfide isomerase/thioredoxin